MALATWGLEWLCLSVLPTRLGAPRRHSLVLGLFFTSTQTLSPREKVEGPSLEYRDSYRMLSCRH